jgi:outer membrane protein OmpA-like peptidoglycan-associated protein
MKTISFKKTMILLFSMALTVSVYAYTAPSPKIAKGKIIPAKTLAAMSFKNVEFGFNKATVPASAYVTLDKVAKLMVENDAALKLGGYADNKGGYVYNWKLSKARADAVKAYLVKKGANESRIAATEYGYTKPVASNSTSSGRKKNRRVEIKFAE